MMKTIRTRIPALAMAAAMTLSLSACSGGGLTTDDASKGVQVELDATYKGSFAGFVDFYSNVTTEDAKKQYDANVEGESRNFINMYGLPSYEDTNTVLEASEMQMNRAKELYKDIYAKADYSITSTNKQDDGTFAVKVNIKPMDIIKLVDDNFEEGFAEFDAKFSAIADQVNTMEEDEFLTWYTETYAREYYDTLLDVLEEQVPNIGYLDEKSIVIQVQQSEEGALFISDEDFGNLDWLIIDYNM